MTANSADKSVNPLHNQRQRWNSMEPSHSIELNLTRLRLTLLNSTRRDANEHWITKLHMTIELKNTKQLI